MIPNDKKQRLIVIVVILLALVGGALIFNSRKDSKTATPTTSANVMKYPAGWSELKLSSTDIAQKVILRASQSAPQGLFVVRSLNISLGKDFVIASLPAQLEAKYKKEFTGYKTVSSKIAKLGVYNSVQIKYTRLSSAKKTLEELRITLPTQEKTYYLTLSSGEQSFSAVEAELMTVAENFANYLASQE